MSDLTLKVNGQTVTLDPERGETLLTCLRNRCGMTATRQGCSSGHCGACTVIMDGNAVQACQVFLTGQSDASIETLEAVRETALGGRIAAALIDRQAAQCGYCLSGIVMSAYAALSRAAPDAVPDPVAYLGRNLCRCGAHPRILAALRGLATEAQP